MLKGLLNIDVWSNFAPQATAPHLRGLASGQAVRHIIAW
jgi:hypothetical protein